VNSLQGKLLVSSPSLVDPNFRKTVVLVAHHDDEGAMGLVLSRPSDVAAADAVPLLDAWKKEKADEFRELYAFDPTVAETQVAKLARVRRERDDRAARAALRRLSDEARGPVNLMEAIVEAVKAYATLGEVNRAMKDVFGEHKEAVQW